MSNSTVGKVTKTINGVNKTFTYPVSDDYLYLKKETNGLTYSDDGVNYTSVGGSGAQAWSFSVQLALNAFTENPDGTAVALYQIPSTATYYRKVLTGIVTNVADFTDNYERGCFVTKILPVGTGTGIDEFEIYTNKMPTSPLKLDFTLWETDNQNESIAVVNEPNNPQSRVIETHIINAWTALADKSPFDYSTIITLSMVGGTNDTLELINDDAVLFATYGFAIGSLTGASVEIYSIGQPITSVTIKTLLTRGL